MIINFCTLFDSKYLDKGLALIHSLREQKCDFVIYVLCMDEMSYSILNDIGYESVVTGKLSELENECPELSDVKSKRSRAEYCWTCTAASVEFFMNKYDLENITYVDADIYFFSNPKILFDEINENGANIAIMKHMFPMGKRYKNVAEKVGEYCVEFNYFDNSPNGKACLKWWKEACIEWCYQKYEKANENHLARYGDQKYLEEFLTRFSNVHVIQNKGAGVAPWNIKEYALRRGNIKDVALIKDNKEIPLIFYHFQNIKYISSNIVNVNSGTKNRDMKTAIYVPYLIEIEKIRKFLLQNYFFSFDVKKSYSRNAVKRFIQRNLMQYKVHTPSDLYYLKEVR